MIHKEHQQRPVNNTFSTGLDWKIAKLEQYTEWTESLHPNWKSQFGSAVKVLKKHFIRKCNTQAQTNATIPSSSMVTGTFAAELCTENKTAVELSLPKFCSQSETKNKNKNQFSNFISRK